MYRGADGSTRIGQSTATSDACGTWTSQFSDLEAKIGQNQLQSWKLLCIVHIHIHIKIHTYIHTYMYVYIYICTSWIFKSDAVGNSDRGSTPGNLETDEHLKLPRWEALSHSFGEPYATLESLESRIVMFDRLRKTSGSWCTQMRGKYASGSWTWIFLASESPLVKNGFTMDLPSAFSKMMFNKGKICPSYSAYGLTYLHPISGEKIWKPIVDRQTHCCQKHSKTHIAIHTALSIPKEGLWGFIPFIPWFHMIPGCRTHENSGPESSPHLCCWPENRSPEPCSKCLTSWQQIRKCLRHRLRFAMFCLCAYLVLCGAYVGFRSPEFCLLPQPSKGPLPKHEHKGLERGSPVITSARRHPEVWDAYWDAYVHLWGHLQETGMIVRKDCGTHFPVATQSFIHNESQYIIYMYIYMCVCACVCYIYFWLIFVGACVFDDQSRTSTTLYYMKSDSAAATMQGKWPSAIAIMAIIIMYWLLVDLPLWNNMTNRQLGWWNSQLNGRINKIFQTTNQCINIYIYVKM